MSGVGDEFHQSGGLPWLGISDLEAWDMFVVSSTERLPTETLFHHPLLGIFSTFREAVTPEVGVPPEFLNFVCGL